jgi:hypothetical protein
VVLPDGEPGEVPGDGAPVGRPALGPPS